MHTHFHQVSPKISCFYVFFIFCGVINTGRSSMYQKQVYKRNTAAQAKTMEHANVAYLNDLSKIDAETSRAEQARSLEQLKMRQVLQ